MIKLQQARAEFNGVLEYLCAELPELTQEDFEKGGFEQFAEKIPDARLKTLFCQAAETLLRENLREHLALTPLPQEFKSAQEVSELKEWRETLITWEAALHAMRRLGGA